MSSPPYQQLARLNIAALLALTVGLASCSVRDVGPFDGSWEVDQQALSDWRPDGADPQVEPGLLWTSRFWASPNPILLPLPTPGAGGVPCAGVFFQSIGPEPIRLLSARYEGHPLADDGLEGAMYPVTFSDGSTGGGSGWFTMLCGELLSPQGYQGALVFTTDDPIAPEVRVEVHGLPLDQFPYDPASSMHPNNPHSRLHFSKNPVRVVHAHGPQTIEVVATRDGTEPLNLLGIDALGPDVTVHQVAIQDDTPWDGTYPVALTPVPLGDGLPVEVEITLSYAPTSSTPHDDALIVAFDDGGLESHRVVVPIDVR